MLTLVIYSSAPVSYTHMDAVDKTNIPEEIYVLSSEIAMSWPGWKETLVLTRYRYSKKDDMYFLDKSIEDEQFPAASTPEEFIIKAEILGYSPCLKSFGMSSLCGMMKRRDVETALAERESDGRPR